MSKSPNQKLKIAYLLRILREKTDEEHGLSAAELIRELERYGVTAERKSIYDDIELLRDYFHLSIEHDRAYGYRLTEREFDLPELKLLVDAVQSSRFVSTEKSEDLIRKLKGLTSEWKARELQRQVTVKDRVKSLNKTTPYAIDTIYNAILHDRAITFQYWSWTPKKEQKARHAGKQYKVSPWTLLWDDEYYYLIAYDAEQHQLRHYRVDRMRAVTEAASRRDGREAYEKLDISDYSKGVFGMFRGDLTHVTFRCKDRLADVVLDRFGKDVILVPDTDGTFVFHADIDVSDQFFGWLASFADEIRIERPQHVADAFCNHIRRALGQY